MALPRIKLEVKTFYSTDFKILDPTAEAPFGSIEGYASTWDNYDRHKEAVKKGAFLEGLPIFLKEGFVANSHDWAKLPIAMPVSAREDEKGLYVVGNFHSHSEAQAARSYAAERLAAGLAVKLSIGYKVLDAKENSDGTRDLIKLGLFEWSLVTLPANNSANVLAAKGLFTESEDEEASYKELIELTEDETGNYGLNSLLVGTTFAKHSELALDVVDGWLDRSKQINQYRAKENRSISTLNEGRLTGLKERILAVVAEIDTVLASNAKKPVEIPVDTSGLVEETQPKAAPNTIEATKTEDVVAPVEEAGSPSDTPPPPAPPAEETVVEETPAPVEEKSGPNPEYLAFLLEEAKSLGVEL